MPSFPTDSQAETAGVSSRPAIDERLFRLPDEGLSPVRRQTALSALSLYEAARKVNFLGYQTNHCISFGDLAQYLTLHMNNVGDPFTDGNFTMNTKFMERAVLDYYAALWGATTPHDVKNPESYWGYVLTMGSTEGNLYGLWNARDYLSGKMLLIDPDSAPPGLETVPRRLIWHQAPLPRSNANAFTPVIFYSQDTHYSVIKIVRILAINTFYELGTQRYPKQCPITATGDWPQEVPSTDGPLGPGTIDIEALARLVEFFAAKGHPILVSLNYGTTFKGAYDDVGRVGGTLKPILERHGLWTREVVYDAAKGLTDTRTGFWIHVDGALGATYMPFISMAYDEGRISHRGPDFDFRLDWVHSLCTSGHKWPGAPFPTGIYMTRVKYQLRPPSDPAYIGAPDTTLAGSRSGLAAAVLWDYLATHSKNAQIERALRTEELADFAVAELRCVERLIGMPLWVQRTDLSLSVLFRKPNQDIVFEYSLSCEDLWVTKTELRQYAHIYMMEHITKAKLRALMADLAKPGAFPDQPPLDAAEETPLWPEATPGIGHPLVHVPHSGRGWS